MIFDSVKNKMRRIPYLIRLWRLINQWMTVIIQPRPKRIYNLILEKNKSQPIFKRALLSYIVHPFFIDKRNPGFFEHINNWHAQEIVRILNQIGCTVDVIDYKDIRFVPRRRYDLFIGHGGTNFEKISQHLQNSTIRIYFSTGSYWKYHNKQEIERFDALKKRRGIDLPFDRFIQDSEEYALLVSDGIIGIGNDFTRRTYKEFSPVIMLNATAIFDDHYEKCDKDFEKGKKHFLYFAGSGPVHKGLDLLLEAFSGMKEHLWICSRIDQRFEEIYSEELHNTPNIHLVGWTRPRSAGFYELMDICNYVILPSCSEGQAHSVVECMNKGLVPVVSRACGLDVGNYGIIIDPCTIKEITKVVLKLSSLSANKCKVMSRNARRAAIRDFSEEVFSDNFKKVILHMIDQRLSQEGDMKKNQNQGLNIAPTFIGEDHKMYTGREAVFQLKAKNDERYLEEKKGIVEVDMERWKEAQGYEHLFWMEGDGLHSVEDRNREHEIHFGNYAVIQSQYFSNAIELGCGPFTNMIRILNHVRCKKITLLDPLINEYLTHPNCTYKHKRLGKWLGKKVETVAEPIESFSSNQVYDLVVVINVLEHCFSALKIFDRVISLVAPNGVLVFHDKLIPDSQIYEFVTNIYDSGHPLRVAKSLILRFLFENYDELFQKRVPIPSPIGAFDSIYFLGRKRGG